MKIKLKDAKPFLRMGISKINNGYFGGYGTANHGNEDSAEIIYNAYDPNQISNHWIKKDEEINLLPPIRGRICDLFPYLKVGMKINHLNAYPNSIIGTIEYIEPTAIKFIEVRAKDEGFYLVPLDEREMEIIEEPPEQDTEETQPEPVEKICKNCKNFILPDETGGGCCILLSNHTYCYLFAETCAYIVDKNKFGCIHFEPIGDSNG